MVLVKGGTFRLGETEAALVGETQFATKWLKELMPQHRVTLSDYYIGVCEVTQGLWKEVMKNNPSKMKGDNLPVTDVSWYDALQFVEALNLRTKLNFRLPTDAEWVYAARSGERQEHYRYAGSDVLYCFLFQSAISSDKLSAGFVHLLIGFYLIFGAIIIKT